MNTYDFVHLVLHAMGGEIKGKTKFQKTVYFVGLLTDTVDDLGYRAHFYGPYSSEVAGAAGQLRALGFATQTAAGGGSVDQAGFEVARYDLRLTDEGERMARAKAEKYPQEWGKIKKAAETLKRADEQDYVKLSIAAKTYFMLGQRRDPVRIKDLAELAESFGWSVTPDQVHDAAQFLQSLGMVEFE
jgi:uncharacterized protein YwgA